MDILDSDLHRDRSVGEHVNEGHKYVRGGAEAFKVSQTQLLKLDPDVPYLTADQ